MNNGKMKNFGVIMALLVALLTMSGAVSALDASIDFVKLDGDLLETGLNNIQDMERNNEFEIKVKVTADELNTEDLENVEIEAMMSGYDHNDRVSDVTEVFDMKPGVSYTKKLTLSLPHRMDNDQYRLRVYVRDRAGDELQQEFFLYVDTSRHSVEIKNLDVYPASYVEAGRSLRVIADLKNYGQLDEDDVKVNFAVPELGLVSLPDYLDIESGDTEVTEELYLRIPVCEKAGQYTGTLTVVYDEGDETETQDVLVNVVSSPVCGLGAEETEDAKPVQKTVITVGALSQDLEGVAVYPVTFTNAGTESKTYVLSVGGTEGWADVKISPLQTVVVGEGESKSVYVYVSAAEDAAAGAHAFTVDVSDAEGNVVKQLSMTANVTENTDDNEGLKKTLEIGMIVLVVLLVVVALIVVFTRRNDDDEDDDDEISGQTYY